MRAVFLSLEITKNTLTARDSIKNLVGRAYSTPQTQ